MTISWTVNLKKDLEKGTRALFKKDSYRQSLYRPFSKYNLYSDKQWIERTLQIPKLFPAEGMFNIAICLTGLGTNKLFSTIATDVIPDVQLISNGQCYSLYLYEKIECNETNQGESLDLLAESNQQQKNNTNIVNDEDGNPLYRRKDAITDEGLAHFVDYYAEQMSADDIISKEDLFYYIYGLLHSEDYRERYAENLTKQLPNIPRVKVYKDFIAFSKAGRELADLHINYETIDMYQGVKITSKPINIKLADGQNWAKSSMEDSSFYVTKMKYAKRNNEETGKNEDDPTKIIYNNHITVENIPEEACDYVVNGKPAIDWIMERQSVKTDKKTEITNDANDWALETMNNARYPLELLLRVINVSLKTQKIVNGLPDLVLE